MRNSKTLSGIFLAGILIVLSLLTTNQVTRANEGVPPAVFSEALMENMSLWYNITDFETIDGQTSGPAAIGFNTYWHGWYDFWGYNLTVSEGDLIHMKVDTRPDGWEHKTGDNSLLYWNRNTYGLSEGLGYTLSSNNTLWPDGNPPASGNWSALQVDYAFSSLAFLPTHQKLVYPPQDGQDYSDKMLPTFGDPNDNGTIDLGYWNGSGTGLRTNVTYEWNCTYYMYYDSWMASLGYTDPATWIRQLTYNKIPARFSTGTNFFGINTTFAHWNYSEYDMYYTQFHAGKLRVTSLAYAEREKGYWPPKPYVFVTTDIHTGIAESIEFYFGNDSAWFHNYDWKPSGPHPLATQVSKLKLELSNITYPTVGFPGFKGVSIIVGICLATLVVFLARRARKLKQ